MTRITPCLWFDTEGEEAAAFYVSLFKNSRITDVSRYGEAGPRPAGTVMVVCFELDGQPFTALNGGPEFTFNEAISFQIDCSSQEEVDHYWEGLTAGGEEGPCGWLKDRYGVSWQVVPERGHRPAPGPGCRAVAAGDGGHDDDEEDRHRGREGGRRQRPDPRRSYRLREGQEGTKVRSGPAAAA